MSWIIWKAAYTKTCVVLNSPLYYYIRATQTSLMSHFGTDSNENEYNRLEQLLHLCGDITPEIEKDYETALANLKKNYVYQVVHKKSNKKEILSFIESVMQDGKAKQHYRIQKNILMKENIRQGISWIMALPGGFMDACSVKNEIILLKK